MPGLQIDHDAWALVGDGEKALVFRNGGVREFPNLQAIRQLESENPKTSEQGTDAPGRKGDGPGPQKNAMEQTD